MLRLWWLYNPASELTLKSLINLRRAGVVMMAVRSGDEAFEGYEVYVRRSDVIHR